MKSPVKIAIMMFIPLQPLCAAEWSDELVQLFIDRGVSESVIRSGRGFTATSMSPDGVSYTIKAPCVLTRDRNNKESASTSPVNNEVTPNKDSGASIVESSNPKKILTQKMIGEKYKAGAKYGCACFKHSVVLDQVEFGEEGKIISGKIISGFIEQNGLIYGPETIFMGGNADKPHLQF